MRRVLLSGVALLALTATASAQGSHANPQYPSPEAFQRAGEGANIGGFGRLFPVRAPDTPGGLLPHPSPRYDLQRLGERMTVEETGEAPSNMPAGYVFLGQFIDHDITFDTVTGFDKIAATGDIENARTADLDLDCVYGGGPERTPYLYDGPYLRVGAITVQAGDPARERHDVLRASPPGKPTAVIGDPRNDENFIVSQVQQAFIAYHNRMVDRVLEGEAEAAREVVRRYQAAGGGVGREAHVGARAAGEGASLSQIVAAARARGGAEAAGPGGTIDRAFVLQIAEESGRVGEILELARELTIHHYHRVIAEDFIPRIIGIARTRDILENGRDFYFPNGFRTADGTVTEPFIPLEFAAAAYRFGHSQVPGLMRLRGGRSDAVLAELFSADKAGQSPNFLKPDGFTPTRLDIGSLAIDWNLFIPIHGNPGLVQRARRLDTTLADPLAHLHRVGVVGPGGLGNLASRNLTRGLTYQLPSGQALAAVILQRLAERGVLDKVYPSDGADGVEDYILPADAVTRETLALGVTPLWYYILQEANAFGASYDANVPGAESLAQDPGAAMALPAAVSLSRSAQEARVRHTTGATLGPVGGTLVGEVLLGLVEYHRSESGKGVDLNTPLAYATLGLEPIAEGDLPAMTETEVDDVGGVAFGRRYLFRNFLHDAGVSGTPLARDVCVGAALRVDEGC
ncbi:peroxidase family protein [Acuticoccus mangrovi]|uniref:Peroxidase n=1 Tax=Acuticoccus mangrovi TaxID=2796142 RepID=A0A934IJ62_9HYPH|nr:peroxidase family protein [Acuticoccus mangrovi]MBJ3774707.1 hypothetical protein [Acuticoccus mangrovi]